MIQINDDNWNNGEVVSKGITVVKVSATWCGPCKSYKPIFEEFAKNHETENVHFAEADADENSELTAKAGVRGIPCTLIYNNGELKSKTTGMIDANKLSELLEAANN